MNKNIIKVSSAVNLNTYAEDKDILFTLQEEKGLFVGKKSNYQVMGEYDNTNNTLRKITNNEKLYSFLYGSYSHIAFINCVVHGNLTIEDIKEAHTIMEDLNIKFYDIVDEEDNKRCYTRK